MSGLTQSRSSPTDDSQASGGGPVIRRPALTACFFLATGILLDRFLELPEMLWATLSFSLLLFFLLFLIAFRFTRCHLLPRREHNLRATTVVLLLLLSVGGWRHHMFWSSMAPDDLSSKLVEDRTLVRVQGTVLNAVEIHDRPIGLQIPAWMEIDRSVFILQVSGLMLNEEWVACSGRTYVTVSGHLLNTYPGDQVEILGELSRPRPVMNPGGFDYSLLLRKRGVRSTLSVNHPAALKKTGTESGWYWDLKRTRVALRQYLKQLFYSEMRPENRGLAVSILLGDRSELTNELKLQFAETGTMHLLALSGLNVGILLGVIYFLGKVCGLRQKHLFPLLILSVLVFIWITDEQPSVTRAGIMAIIGLMAGFLQQRADGWNTLASCAFLLMLLHPPDLFDIGAQLSFLAVGAIVWCSKFSVKEFYLRTFRPFYFAIHPFFFSGIRPSSVPSPSLQAPQSATQPELPMNENLSLFEKVCLFLAQVYFVSIIIWVVTLPVVVSVFHLVTPVGIFIDLLLIPLGTLVLASGYGFLIAGWLHPWLGSPVAVVFEFSLIVLQQLIRAGQAVPGGHFYVPDTPHWWLVAYYLSLALSWQLIPLSRLLRGPARQLIRFSWPSMLIVGLLIPLFPARQHERGTLTLTFLAVGHGLACVIELPTGECLLYDCGNLGDGRISQTAVEQFLWRSGRRRIDSVILSHADSDHYNGMFELLTRFKVDRLFLSSQSARSPDEEVQELLKSAVSESLTPTILQAGTTLVSRHDREGLCRLHVLHPRADSPPGSDNAQSLMMKIDYAGKAILLTGDIEGEALQKLMRDQVGVSEILLLPHHGSVNSHPAEVIKTFQPAFAVMSAARDNVFSAAGAHDGVQIFRTFKDGAVRCQIDETGNSSVSSFISRSNKH